jgi:hypothetical protein
VCSSDLPSSGEDAGGRTKYIGNSPLSLENKNTQVIYHTNKIMFDKLGMNHKVNLYSQDKLLNENNIIEDIE